MIFRNFFVALCLFLVSVSAFRPILRSSSSVLRMSEAPTDANEAQWDILRKKYQANPNYNPMNDPEAAPILENLIPNEFRELKNALQRLRVAFVDASTAPKDADGTPGEAFDLDKMAAQFDKKELIQSPQSKWIKEGMQDVDYSASKAEELLEELKKKYPQASQMP
jgi:hypothetical protein